MAGDDLRVLFDAQAFIMQRFGGISRTYAELLTHLAGQGVDARAFAPLHQNAYLSGVQGARTLGPSLPANGRMSRAVSVRIPAIATRLAARLSGAEIVHETYFGRASSAPDGVPAVTTIYDMIHEHDASFAGDPVIAFKAAAINRAERVICISEHTRRDMVERFPQAEAKAVVIPLAASMPEPGANPVESGRPYILYVGERGREYKNFTGLVAAFQTSEKLRTTHRLVAVGGRGFTAGEVALLRDAGIADHAVQISAAEAQLAALYRDAGCLVYPSTYEGFGIPPLEAMGLGCPVVALRAASIPEVCGDAATYADDPSGEALAQAIEQVVFDDAETARMRAAGIARAAQFSWDRCAREHAAVYRDVAGRA